MNIETAKKHYYMYLNDKLNQLGAFKNVFEAVHVSNVVAKKFLIGAEARDRPAFIEAFGEANKLIDANISRMSTIELYTLHDARIVIEAHIEATAAAETPKPARKKKTKTVEVEVSSDEDGE